MLNSMTPQRTFLLSGAGYLFIFITGIYSNFMVVEPFINGQENLNPLSISTGLASFWITALIDVLLAGLLFMIFRSIELSITSLSMVMRLFHAILFGVALAILSVSMHLPSNQELSSLSLNLYKMMWDVGLLFFAIHLLTMGWLMIKSVNMPTWIGIGLALAGMGYVLDSGSRFLGFTDESIQEFTTVTVVLCAVLGELAFTIWLLKKGFSSTKNVSTIG